MSKCSGTGASLKLVKPSKSSIKMLALVKATDKFYRYKKFIDSQTNLSKRNLHNLIWTLHFPDILQFRQCANMNRDKGLWMYHFAFCNPTFFILNDNALHWRSDLYSTLAEQRMTVYPFSFKHLHKNNNFTVWN